MDAAHAAPGPSGGRLPGVHAQTVAVYALIDELRRRHPGVEIESCAGGGGRVDLEILQRTDRIWTSDCNDPLERQQIQRWTSMLVAPELIGAHVGPARAHTTARVADLSFRAGTALFGHFGIEWDLTAAGDTERAELAEWIAVYKRFRGLLHSGRTVRADSADDAVLLHGVVAVDGSEALFALVQMATSSWALPAPVLLPGLSAERSYRVRPVLTGGGPETVGAAGPAWWPDGVTLPGSVLADMGLPGLLLGPQQLALLHVTSG